MGRMLTYLHSQQMRCNVPNPPWNTIKETSTNHNMHERAYYNSAFIRFNAAFRGTYDPPFAKLYHCISTTSQLKTSSYAGKLDHLAIKGKPMMLK